MTVLTLVLAAGAQAAALLGPGDFATATRWVPMEGSPDAQSIPADGASVLRLPCPFTTLNGWRVAWDLPFEKDLTPHRWLKLRVRADDPEAVATVHLYFEAGGGWYTMALGGVTKEWRTLTAVRSKFGTEGSPAPWSAVTRLRIAVLPAAKRETAVEVAGFEGTSALTADDAVQVGPYASLADLKAAIKGPPTAVDALQRGESLLARGALPEAHAALVDAYVRAQAGKPGEFRAAWCHNGYGPAMGWAKAIDALADAGFNAIIPNLLWSGVAFYPSTVLPVDKDVATRGDQVQAVLDAAHRRGLKVHVWKVCWQFGWMSDPAVAVHFRFAGRCQVDENGKQGDWLCPSNPLNRTYELDAIRELVTKYPIDGFHLDYIRYGGDEWCFCPVCRKNFERTIGRTLKTWPAPVLKGGAYDLKYRDWRRENITSFVREVRTMTKAIRPACQLSAAVFPVPDSAREDVLQDWGRWVREGLVDFVCPMNYTESLPEMKSRLQAELAAVGGKVPVNVGLYATYGPDQAQTPDTAVAQIVAARELGAGGFTLFELQDHMITGLLPALRLGVTAP